jgi:hypothetical protein
MTQTALILQNKSRIPTDVIHFRHKTFKNNIINCTVYRHNGK